MLTFSQFLSTSLETICTFLIKKFEEQQEQQNETKRFPTFQRQTSLAYLTGCQHIKHLHKFKDKISLVGAPTPTS